MCKLSIFTPTYNRASLLPQLYNSLLEQNNKNFEWIIVDDGSTDNTKNLVEKWIKEDMVSIQYYYKENEGKMQAHNMGVQKASYPLFVCVDSDDFLTGDFVATILNSWESCSTFDEICGIMALRKVLNSSCTNKNNLNVHECYMTLEQLSATGQVAETVLVFRTEIIKLYPFPKFKNEKFLTEDYVYTQIDSKYKYKFINRELVIGRYQTDGYTFHFRNLVLSNPYGFLAYFSLKSGLSKLLKNKIKYSLLYLAMTHHTKMPLSKTICNSKNNLLVFLLLPFRKILQPIIFKRFLGFKN